MRNYIILIDVVTIYYRQRGYCKLIKLLRRINPITCRVALRESRETSRRVYNSLMCTDYIIMLEIYNFTLCGAREEWRDRSMRRGERQGESKFTSLYALDGLLEFTYAGRFYCRYAASVNFVREPRLRALRDILRSITPLHISMDFPQRAAVESKSA